MSLKILQPYFPQGMQRKAVFKEKANNEANSGEVWENSDCFQCAFCLTDFYAEIQKDFPQ